MKMIGLIGGGSVLALLVVVVVILVVVYSKIKPEMLQDPVVRTNPLLNSGNTSHGE